MNILVTGASGFLGTALVPRLIERGHYVYGLSRHPPEATNHLLPLIGDILEPNLGLSVAPKIDAVHHLAAIHHLGEDKDGMIWKTNVEGTKNVLAFCANHDIRRLYFTSTAYTQGRNTYERSKALCEQLIQESDIPQVTIFKPSVIMGTKQHFYPGHFSQFIKLLIQIHQRADLVRRKIEGTLRLPILEPVFRINGNPDGKLNLVSIEAVASATASINQNGKFWLTNPKPPVLKDLVKWVGDFIMVKLVITQEPFTPTPLEAMFQKMSTAFQPYLQGDDFPSNITNHPPISKEFIHETIMNTLLS